MPIQDAMSRYYLRILRDDIPLAMDILADILKNSIFDPEELERERGVILQEINRTIDTPDDIIFDYFQETAYPNQPMGYPILGETARIETLTRKDIMNFMHTRYQPGNMVLAAAGAISHKQIIALAQQNFGAWKSRFTNYWTSPMWVGISAMTAKANNCTFIWDLMACRYMMLIILALLSGI